VLNYGGDVKMAVAHPRGLKLAMSDLVDAPTQRFAGKTKAGPVSPAAPAAPAGSASSASSTSSKPK